MGNTTRVGLWAPAPPPVGGVTAWAQLYLRAAPRHGIEATLIDTSPREAMHEASLFRWKRAQVAAATLGQLAKLVAQRRIDVAHLTTTLFWATVREAAAVAACKAAGVPSVLHIHGSNQMIAWRQGLPRAKRQGLDAVLRASSAVMVLSRELEDYLRAELPRLRVYRTGNPVDIEAADAAARLGTVLPARKCPVRVLFVGSLMPLKGVGQLCDAVREMPEVELVLVGGASQYQNADDGAQLQRSLELMRQTGRLTECGELAPEQIARAYPGMDIFCLPSWREGLPNVLLEAMAARLPCVVTPVGAIPEAVGSDGALVVPVNDVAKLREALATLAGDADLRARLGARGRQIAEETFGVDVLMRRYCEIYQEVATHA